MNRQILVGIASALLIAGFSPSAAAQDLTQSAQPAGRAVNEASIYFEADSSEITKMGMRLLGSLVEYHLTDNDNLIHLVGHVNGTALTAKALAVSEERAKAVATALRELGVEDDRISYEFVGTADPVKNPHGRKVNPALQRRVTMTIIQP